MSLLEELSLQSGLPPAPMNPGLTMGLESLGMPQAPPQAGLLGALTAGMPSTPLASPKQQRNAKIQAGVKDFAETLLFTLGQSMAAAGASPRGGGRATQAGIGAALQAPLVLKQLKQKEAERVEKERIDAEDRKREIEQQGMQNWFETQRLKISEGSLKVAQTNAVDIPPDYTLNDVRYSGKTNTPLAGTPGVPNDTRTPEERFIDLKLREEAVKVGGKLPVEREAELRKAARAEWTDAGRENNPALDAINMQIKELQVDLAESRIRAAQGDGGLTPKQLASTLSLSNSLKSHPAYTDMLDISSGMQGVDAGLSQKNGFGDITAINAFQKMVDPGATVREGDVALLQSASAFMDKILSEYPIAKLKSGAKLPDATREQMRKTAKQLYETRAKNYNDTVGGQYKSLSSAAKIPFEYVGQDFAIDSGSAAPTGGTAPEGTVITNAQGQKQIKRGGKWVAQ